MSAVQAEIVRLISAKKNEPDFMLQWRLKSYRHWLTMKEPTWQRELYEAAGFDGVEL